jgi:hypothetical protein
MTLAVIDHLQNLFVNGVAIISALKRYSMPFDIDEPLPINYLIGRDEFCFEPVLSEFSAKQGNIIRVHAR